MIPLPALLGGPAVRPQGPPDWPLADPAIEEAVRAALLDGSWGKYHSGRVEHLEKRLAELHGVPHVLTCASGTYAVELALRALKVAAGEEVLLAAYDYPGNFLNVHALNARPVLIDVVATSATIDLEQLEGALAPLTRTILVSHLHGGLVPMARLMNLARQRGLRVIEDACQCPGASVDGRPAGAWGDIGILSFGGSKLLSAGRGGALITAHADVMQRARVFQQRANLLAPLSELQAAVLIPQLDQLEARNRWRLQQVDRLRTLCVSLPGLQLFAATDGEPGYYKVGFRYDAATFGLARALLTAALRAEGIALDEGFRALHVGRSPSRYRQGSPLREAARAGEDVLVLHHPILLGSAVDLEQIVEAVRKIYHHRTLFAGAPHPVNPVQQ